MNRLLLLSVLSLSLMPLISCRSAAPKVVDPVLTDAEYSMRAGAKAYAQADRNNARWYFQQALQQYQSLDDEKGMLICYINLAEIALADRDIELIQQHLQSASLLILKKEFQQFRSRITLIDAQAAILQQDYARAETLLQPLLAIFSQSKFTGEADIILLTALANRARIALYTGQELSLWLQRFADALAQSEVKHTELQALLLRFQAQYQQQQSQYEIAAEQLLQALELYKSSYARSGIGATLAELGQLAMLRQDWRGAENYYQRSNQVFEYLQDTAKVKKNLRQLIVVSAELEEHEYNTRLKHQLNALEAEK